MANVYMVIDTPDEKLKSFLQYLHDFDESDRNSVSMVEVVVHAPKLSEEVVAVMFKEIGMPYMGKVKWAEKAAKMEWKRDA